MLPWRGLSIEGNAMSFVRDTRVIPINIVLYRGPGVPREGKIWGSAPVRSDAAYRQFSLAIIVLYISSFLRGVYPYLPLVTNAPGTFYWGVGWILLKV